VNCSPEVRPLVDHSWQTNAFGWSESVRLVHGVNKEIASTSVTYPRPLIVCIEEHISSMNRVSLWPVRAILLILLAQASNAAKLEAFSIDSPQCHAGSIKNTGQIPSLGALKSVNTASACLIEGGLCSKGSSVSETSVAALSKLLGKHGFSVELWLQPVRTLVASTPIISFGADKVSAYLCANNFAVPPFLFCTTRPFCDTSRIVCRSARTRPLLKKT
jgi:hypothetical protein